MSNRECLSVAEQVVAAEVAYGHQYAIYSPTQEDIRTWQDNQAMADLVGRTGYDLFERHVLERHGFSLHRYMATHLSQEAWAYWFAQGGLLFPIRG